MGSRKTILCQRAAHQGDAGRHAAYANLRRQSHGEHACCTFEPDFRDGVGQEIGVQVEHFLVQQIHNATGRAVRNSRGECFGEQ